MYVSNFSWPIKIQVSVKKVFNLVTVEYFHEKKNGFFPIDAIDGFLCFEQYKNKVTQIFVINISIKSP